MSDDPSSDPMSTPGGKKLPPPPATPAMTAIPVTRAMSTEDPQRKMTRIIDQVLLLDEDSTLQKSLKQMRIANLVDLRTLTEKDIDEMTYTKRFDPKIKSDAPTYRSLPVEFQERKYLKLFLKWITYIVVQRRDQRMGTGDWEALTNANFVLHIEKYPSGAPSLGPSSSKSGGDVSSTVVTTNRVDNFLSSIKLEANSFPKFNGKVEQWLHFKRKMISAASIHALDRVLADSNDKRTCPAAGSEDERLFEKQKVYIYSIFARNCSEGSPLLMIRKHDVTRDGRAVFLEMKAFFESSHNMMVVVQKCYRILNEMRLTRGYNGGAERFLNFFQNTYLDLEYASKDPKEDVEKKARLLAAIHDPHYYSVRDVMATDPNKSYQDCINCLSQHAALFSQATTQIKSPRPESRRANSETTRRPGRQNGGGRYPNPGRKPNNNPNDKGRHRSTEEWNNLSQAERDEILEIRRNKRRGGGGRRHANSSNSNQDSGRRDDDQGEEKKPPTIRSIMKSQTRNTNITVTIRNMSAAHETSNGDAIVDGGADTNVLGANFVVITKDVHRKVTIIGCKEDTMQSKGHCIGSGLTKARTTDGDYVLLISNESVCMGTGKSLLSCNQIRAAGHDVNDIPRKYGGLQSLQLKDGVQIPMVYKDGLCTMEIMLPNSEDMKNLVRNELTNDTPWDPVTESDATEDQLLGEYQEWVDDINMRHALAGRTKKDGLTDIQLERMRNCLLFKPTEVVKKTIENTTQYAHNFVHTPLRQHWKARFPGLNCRRMREVMCTDTFFSSQAGRNGETCAQLYVGKCSTFTVVKCMQTESQMADTLYDLIREYGAPTALFSDNAKSETSNAVKDILRQYNIKDMQSEPHHPNQNPAERRIGTIKRTTNHVMSRTDSPKDLWFMCMQYVVMILNHVAVKSLQWKTPVEVAFGTTPDISALLQFRWFEPVRYLAMVKNKWVEKDGHFVGVANNIGDALTTMSSRTMTRYWHVPL